MATKAITWQTTAGGTMTISVEAERVLTEASIWPRDSRGEEYAQVSVGARQVRDADIDAELASEIVAGRVECPSDAEEALDARRSLAARRA